MTIAALDAYRQSKPCREYQIVVADQMVAHLDSNQIPIMVMPTGAGKSRTAAEIMGRVAKRRGLVVTHTDVLYEQSKSTIPGCSVLNIQALTKAGAAGDARRAALSEYDAAFVDECFVSSTIVSAVGTVYARSSRPAPDRLIGIDGVVSTPDHPYLTTEGWKRAEEIVPGDLCCVRSDNSAGIGATAQDLFPRVSLEAIERDHELHQQASRECKAARVTQHDPSTRSQGKSQRDAEENRPQTTRTGRERPWAYVAGSAAGKSYRAAPAGSDDAGRRAAVSLQVGPSLPIDETGDRDRRRDPSIISGSNGGSAEGQALGWKRVDRVEIHEQGGRGRYDEVCPDGRVYNIETASGVYFAGQFLVHNCHHAVSPMWLQGMQMLRQHGLMVFGATATPQRGDGRALNEFWTDMVVGPKYSELVRCGFLCPCDVQRPKMSRAEQRRKKVRIDGVVSYLEHGRREDGSFRPGIYFDKTIADCIDAAQRLNEAGVRAKVVSCEVTGKDRQDIFDAYSRGELDMLCSPVALAEGFDSPRAEVCVLCRSASSIGTYLQMVGRILRPCAGKERALLIDCTGAESIHKAPTADRLYSLHGAGIEDAPEEDEEELSEEEQKELVLREEWKKVRAEFELVRDQLVNTYTGLRQTATDKSYKNGWVFYQFQNETGLQAPRIIESKYRSVCCHCRRRVEVGAPILWQAPKQVYHQDCWFQTLTDDQLSAYKNRNQNALAAQ